MGIGVLLLGFYQSLVTAATNILFDNILGVSGGQLLALTVTPAAAAQRLSTSPLVVATVSQPAGDGLDQHDRSEQSLPVLLRPTMPVSR